MRAVAVRTVVVGVVLTLLVQLANWQVISSTAAAAASLPYGAAADAPDQRSGSAEGLDPRSDPASTKTSQTSVARKPPRPRGAVPDRLVLPPVKRPEAEAVTVKVRTTSVAPPRRVHDRRSSVELVKERTASSTVFRNADGSRTLRMFSGVAHVRTSDGTWGPADLRLSTASGRIVPRRAPYDVSFGATGGDGLGTIRLDHDHELRFDLLGAVEATGEMAGAKATYRRIGLDTDVVLAATASGIKEDIVLRSRWAATTYDFRLELRGLTPRFDPATGDVALVDNSGRSRATIPAGWMRDARGVVSHAVRYEVGRAGPDWTLRVSADRTWLADPQRAWPVTVDPSIQVTADADAYVTKGESVSHSGELQLKIGSETARKPSASFLHFSGFRDALPNQYINGVSLVLANVGSVTCQPRAVDVFAVGVPWSAASIRWPGPALGQHLAQRSFSHGHTGCTAAAWEPFQLDPKLATEWTHGAPFHGLSVRAANEGDTSAFKQFGATESGHKPYLDVTYASQGASYLVDEVTLPTATREGRLKATVRNLGSSTWTPGGPYRLGYIVKQGDTVVQTSPTHAPTGDVGPGGSRQFDIPMGTLAPGDYSVYLTMYDGGQQFHTAYGVPYGLFPLTVRNVPPSSNFQQPGSGASIGSLAPTLYAEGVDDDRWPGTGLKYNFKLCAGTPQAPAECVESGWTGPTWTPPAGKLRWSRSYYWWVQVHDNVDAGPWAGPLALTTVVPQPQITSRLGGVSSGTDAPGLDPQVGNFTLASTDAAVATVGPDLTISRTYNSLDPRRNTAFGSGWSSRLDTSLIPDDETTDPQLVGNVVVTLPNGRQVRFGRNPDRTYAAPQGQNLTLVYDTAEGRYTLRDAAGTTWIFNIHGRLLSITDPDGLTEQLEYDVAGPSGQPKSLYNTVSKRRLYLTWTGPRLTEVRTDPPTSGSGALVWTYTYVDSKLTAACDPGPAPNCTRYDHQTGSRYRSVVLDDNPRGYWRLGEQRQADGVNSATARKPGADRGTYNGVVLQAQGAVAGTADTSAAFDGQSSFIALPEKLISPTMSSSVELWFRTTSGGVLMSAANAPWGSPQTARMPILYVGQDGHLRGGFPASKSDAKQITSAGTVDDGAWHHVVLAGFVDKQTLYVDGVAQADTVAGPIHHDTMPHLTVGAGQSQGWPSGNDADFYFGGGIDEVAVYQHALGATAVREHFAAAAAIDQLTKVTLPQDERVYASIGYDDVNDRVATLTDHDGRSWRLDTPTRDEAVRTVTLHGPYPDRTYRFDADHGGRPTSVTTEAGTRTTEYNEAGFPSAVVDENNHRATSTTDARGNVLSTKTCRAANSCQTSYATYFLNPDNPLDPRNDRKISESDARSSGPDDNRFRTSYSYDTRGRLATATYPRPNGAPTEPTETWTYSTGAEPADGTGNVPAGLLIKQTGKLPGQTTLYSYKTTGDLAVRTGPSGLRTRFGYDAIGRLLTTTTMAADGGVFGTTTNTYDARSRLATVTSPPVTNPLTGVKHTLVTTYGYDANGNTTSVTTSDASGGDPARVTTYRYDDHDALTETTFPDGGKETWAYRNAGQERSRTDVRGTVWTTVTDSRDRPLSEVVSGPGVDPDDAAATILTLRTYSYDPAGRLAATRDAMGRETRYTYFTDDRLATATRVGVQQSDGSRRDVVLEAYEYDEAGHETKLTESGGRVSTATYDPAGFPVLATLDPAGLKRVRSYLRYADGQVRQVSLQGAGEPDPVETTSYRYDTAGRLIAEEVEPTPGDTLSITYQLDERGLVKERADRRRMPTNYTYDAAGQLVTESGPELTTWVNSQSKSGVRPTITVGRNAFGETTHQRDPNGAVSVFDRDPMGRTKATHLPAYTPPGGAAINAVVSTEYDFAGNPLKVTDALNRITTTTYDPFGQVATTTAPKVDDQPSTTTLKYNRAGELASTTDPTGAMVASTYDELGRKLTDAAKERVPAEGWFVTRYGYDDAGNPTSVKSPGGAVTSTAYNAAGEPTAVTDPTGRVTRTTYDRAGRPRTVTDPAGVVTRTDYDTIGRARAIVQLAGDPLTVRRTTLQDPDPNGNPLKITSAEGRVRTFGYDAANRIVSQTEQVSATQTIRTALGYDAAGHRTRSVDGKGNATDYTFNSWGLPEATIEPATAKTPALADRMYVSAYDAAGQLVRQTAPGGVVTTTAYDEQGRRKRQIGTGAEASTVDRVFDYDPAGRVKSFDAPGGQTTLKYDDRGQLLELRGASGDATFGYDADGRLKSRTDAAGSSSFDYDPAGRLKTAVDGVSGRTVNSTFDAAGRLATSGDSGFQYVKRLYDYDDLGRLRSDKVTESDPTGMAGNVMLGTEYGYDDDDKIVTKKTFESNAAKSNAYGYDGAGRLTSWTGPGDGVTTYDWDDAGNRTRSGTTTYTYDERHRLTSDGSRGYEYTARGTMSAVTGTDAKTLAFDAFDRMVTDGPVSYAYDSLDRVGSRGASAFKYGSLENDVVADGNRVVGRGPDGEPFSDKPASGTVTGKPLYADQHGDVTGRYRGLSTYGKRTFDPFGNQTATSGSDPSNLGYQGEWTDSSTGAVNMAARWYTPTSGGFTARDSWNVSPNPSAAANRYSYGAADPMGRADPNGHDSGTILCAPDLDQRKARVKSAWVFPILGPLLGLGSCASSAGGGDASCENNMYRNWCPQMCKWGGHWSKHAYCYSYSASDASDRRSQSRDTRELNDWRNSQRVPTRIGCDCGGPPPRRPPHIPRPRPTPPPLWWVNTDKPLPRPAPGGTTQPRPFFEPGTNHFTTVIEVASDIADTLTTVTDALITLADTISTAVDVIDVGLTALDWLREVMAPDEIEQADKDRGNCLTRGTGLGYPNYWGLDEYGRATGADACLDRNSLVPNASDRGHGVKTGIEVTGHIPHVTDKGHLIAGSYGGHGHIRENLVPVYHEANKYMYNQFEKCVAQRLEAGERIHVTAVPYYSGTSGIPQGIVLNAIGNQGYSRNLTVLNTPRQRTHTPEYCK